MKRMVLIAVVAAFAVMSAVPAFAAPTGLEYGQHHAEHARSMTGFTGEMNPGVHHQGFSGWAEHMEHGDH